MSYKSDREHAKHMKKLEKKDFFENTHSDSRYEFVRDATRCYGGLSAAGGFFLTLFSPAFLCTNENSIVNNFLPILIASAGVAIGTTLASSNIATKYILDSRDYNGYMLPSIAPLVATAVFGISMVSSQINESPNPKKSETEKQIALKVTETPQYLYAQNQADAIASGKAEFIQFPSLKLSL